MLIGELSRRTGVSPRALRYYEEQGLLDVTRKANGYRTYSPDAATVVVRIRRLLDSGLNSDTIRKLLPCIHGDDPGVELCAEVDDLLRNEIRDIRAEIEELTRRHDALTQLLESSDAP
ncbi:MerR family transcriptional regulator [Nocardia puris]|uniref:DNA-binding transcriptional MerR regulator n=1 Tax=Nocardia puris TaxID=208602 RepID=A0A366E1L9_9NOCA|nr:MerR family transcriptional regulator [Nocardia puris]MBF6209525.1 MerR family transcriptional regulator [Nocardia puris]MBF6366097.1 MerR family transcriptional regulator [Nocardia puris]MBF6458562.1 MerR family transcriptional regulator [Nocardia puris]RBO96213.1 DNA-binding transcriptional MerR regulator [Nocardia puris]